MSERRQRWTASLSPLDPAGSRHRGRRSAVTLTDDAAVVGTATGDVVAFDRTSGREQWRAAGPDGASVVSAIPFDGGVVVGERGPDGAVRAYAADGTERWHVETADDVGDPQKDTRFFLPFVVDIATADGRCYVAARRYERRGDRPEGERRHFESVIYAFEGDRTEAWRYATDASPISLAADGQQVAVAYNRCPGDFQHGLAVLDAADGTEQMLWDPGTDGQRRVGDVALLDDDLVVCSHGDYRGYRLDSDGSVRWRVDLATPVERGEDTVYAYPNHVHATASGVVFVTGNTYPEEGRETDQRHPTEHTALGYTPTGKRRWAVDIGGFASGLGTAGDTVAVPCAQNFRRRESDSHACRVFDVRAGLTGTLATDSVVTAAAVDGETVAAVEEPVVYHDDGKQRGQYRVHRWN
ncbi:PQQ-binding-like beta-propeller repeat protein [Salinibaculum rarum]|uniref:outer membrane protein assembly factor BamB family protein n=1 Tax=Salinibaculum rarum TaxID=3058903 RepID=UPI00265F2B6F|nr:PQQ-binding-like beta-propeller repeat protein [Salinibaculum sp. KK48]